MVDKAFEQLSDKFSELYSHTGRPSIAPESLLRAALLQIFYSIRSERLLLEQLVYNLFFRWFVGLKMDDSVWNHSVFSKNRDRLLNTEIAAVFFAAIRDQAAQKKLMSDEHFTVDGALLEAWASMKSYQPKDSVKNDPSGGGSGKNPTVNFRGQKRKNDTHQSVTDPEAKLYKKPRDQQAKLCYLGHALMENRNGLVVDIRVTLANGTAERKEAIEMVEKVPGKHRITLGADKGYDITDFVERMRFLNATPHFPKTEGTLQSMVA
ncbi:hypothetical protein DSCW_00630 [Desulfosarcina widdelii]|uniref:Transposase n=1 Tax=Desulfosarcina widdelii TaxID=947919 RepID=A0A5K7YTG2_9BACT|nr:hypothetical protein DSCW_00630 [Desulfosarcina widdelii]